MLRLNLTPAPYWMDLAHGVRVEVEPGGSTILAAASVDAYAVPVEAEAGGDAPSEPPNPGVQSVAYVKAVARRAIRAWEGVGDEKGNALPVTDEAVDALMEQSPECLRAFREGYVNKLSALADEGNGSSPSPDGTTAGEGTTAETASGDAPAARKSKTAR